MISTTRIPTIIVSYRNPRDVVECLKALQGLAADSAFDVYICENGGAEAFDSLIAALTTADGPCELDYALEPISGPMPRFIRVQSLRLRGREVRVRAAEATENFGYAGAINGWVRPLVTRADWPGVWILNPDTRPDSFALVELVAWSAARGKGMVGSRVVSFAQPDVVRTRGLRWRKITGSATAVGRFAPTAVEPDPDKLEAYLDAPSGVSIYVTRETLERLGSMDEQYFLYFEDLDWGYRAKNSCGVGYAHKSIVRHHGSTTIGSRAIRSEASPLSVYLEFRNRVLFVRQHHRSWMAWTLLILVIRSLEFGIAGAFANMGVALQGLKAGLAGETGRPDALFDFSKGAPRLRKKSGLNGAAAKRRAKVAISLAFHLIASLARLFGRIAGRPARPRLVILYYHEVSTALRAGFARQLDILMSRAPVVRADYRGAATPGGLSVAVTFDDALMSVLDNAIPELRVRQMPATIFVPVGSLGRRPGWVLENNSADPGAIVATADALRDAASDLVQLGAHSLTHPFLSRLPLDDARREIAGCRKQMREIFDFDVRIFSFPYGDYNAAIIALCAEAGYERVFTNLPTGIDPTTDEFIRGRVLVDPADGPLEFYLKTSGAYAWMAHLSAVKKWIALRLNKRDSVAERSWNPTTPRPGRDWP